MAPFGKARPRVTSRGTFMPDSYTERIREFRLRFGRLPDTNGAPLLLRVTGYRPVAKSKSKQARAALHGRLCTTKPDVDNFAGAVMDALFEDDSAVVRLEAEKRWAASPSIVVEVYRVADDE